MKRVLDTISCDIDPEVRVRGQIIYFFLINLRQLQLKTLQVNRSHDVEGAVQYLV